MTPNELVLRCYAEHNQATGLWVSVCLDLSLAAQGATQQEAREHLHSQIAEYVYDALGGQDKAHSAQLINRSAPWQLWAKYYWFLLLHKTHAAKNGIRELFCETLPLGPLQAT